MVGDIMVEVVKEKVDSEPRISLIGYDASFREKFFQINSLIDQTLDKDKFEYIFVENFNEVNPKLGNKLEETSLNYKLITLNRGSSYHLSKCLNAGVRNAGGDIVVSTDADTYYEPSVLKETLEAHKNNDDKVMYIYRYDEPRPPVIRGTGVTLKKCKSRCELKNKNNFGGFMSVKKENYIKAGGYEEHPIFSGYDCAGGADLCARFGNMGLDCYWKDGVKIYHPYHKGGYDSDRYSGFRIESQWRLINKRNKDNDIKPFIGIDGRYRELNEWWEDWLGKFDDKTVDYEFEKFEFLS